MTEVHQTNGGASTATMAVPPLPTFPDPNTFWSQPGPSSLFLLQEARANMGILNDIKTNIQSGGMSYNLSPNRLPPLPPVPRPSSSTIRSTISGTARPNERPELPISMKGKGRAECLSELEDGWEAEERYGVRAIKISSSVMTVWVSMKDEKVVEVKVFLEESGSRADITSPDWNPGLSDHLTSLKLSLTELLYRLPRLPELLKQACFYCNKYLKMPGGMPLHTGYLPSNSSGDGNHETGKEGGKWVCWHESCGE